MLVRTLGGLDLRGAGAFPLGMIGNACGCIRQPDTGSFEQAMDAAQLRIAALSEKDQALTTPAY